MSDRLTPEQRGENPRLTAERFHYLARVPSEIEWINNIGNPRTRRAYMIDVRDFMAFADIRQPDDFRIVTRAHVLAWRKSLEDRTLTSATIRRKFAALSSLFDYLCTRNSVSFNPVTGAKRPQTGSNTGKTPPLAVHDARALLDAPCPLTLKGKRDRAILAVLLYHGLRREELCQLTVGDIRDFCGGLYLRIRGKGIKLRYLQLHPASIERLRDYLDSMGDSTTPDAPLFRAMRNTGAAPLTPDGVYKCLKAYALQAEIEIAGFGVHCLRATAATNALEHGADIIEVQEWLGHANIATTRLYDRREHRLEGTPTIKVDY
jgi:site-specific recombinase XerD